MNTFESNYEDRIEHEIADDINKFRFSYFNKKKASVKNKKLA